MQLVISLVHYLIINLVNEKLKSRRDSRGSSWNFIEFIVIFSVKLFGEILMKKKKTVQSSSSAQSMINQPYTKIRLMNAMNWNK